MQLWIEVVRCNSIKWDDASWSPFLAARQHGRWSRMRRGAQKPDRMRQICALMSYAENDAEAQPRLAAFQEGLRKLGWMENRNLRIESRWAAGQVDRMRTWYPEEEENMTAKTIRELVLDAIDQALAESIRQQFISMALADPTEDGGISTPCVDLLEGRSWELCPRSPYAR
jgi:hypothetical protein